MVLDRQPSFRSRIRTLPESPVLVWLASYPRSGNTLARQVLRQVFGLESYSQYNDPKDIGERPDVAAAVGHVRFESPWPEFIAAAHEAAEPVVVKTHHPPQDDAAAIYVVRDGRAAVVSFYHLLHDLRRRDDVTIERVIDGDTPFGSWSDHLDAWQPFDRPRTLLVRFEDLLAKPAEVVAAMAGLLGVAPKGTWRNQTDRLQGMFPEFFRGGSDARNIGELSAPQAALFWGRHAGWMERLGYRREHDGAAAL
jgi:hypothetical protein